MELADRLGPEARDAQELDEARRHLGPEPVVEGHVAGRGELADLVADGLADARDRRRVARAIGRHEVDRAAPDGVGRAVVGDGLEHELALDLEHVADLVEDPGEVAVGQLGRASRSRHRSPADGSGQAATTRSRPGRLAGRAPGRPRSIRSAIGSSAWLRHGDPDRDLTAGTPRPTGRAPPPRRGPARRPRARSPGSGCAAGRRTPRLRSAPARRPRGPRDTIAPPTARRTSSPVAWPYVSLSALNRSMSIISTPTASSARRRRASRPQNSSK